LDLNPIQIWMKAWKKQ